MLSDAQTQFYRENGYVLGSRVLADDEVAELQEEILRVIRQRDEAGVAQPVLCHNMTGKPDSAIWQIVNIWQASAPFRRLIANRTIVEEVAQLTDAAQLRIWHDQIQYKPAGKGGVNMWHQDSPYWGILRPKDTQVTAWVALDDVDADNGCMSMAPGSHLWGNAIDFLHGIKDFAAMPGEYQGRAVQTRLAPVRKGHVHYHHSLTWHGSHANTSDRPRRAVALHYATDRTRYDASGTHIMKQFVSVPDGAVLAGEKFPQVYPIAQ